jgi:uncharacterized membrane-anchored protein
VTWHATEGTLSIHSITTTRRELFYWATVAATFALGTAVGDLAAISFHLGYLDSALVFAGLILLPALGYRLLSLSAVGMFWMAYVLTRPLGASAADWLAKSHGRGGLGFGDAAVTLVLAALIVVLVGYLTVTRADTPRVANSLDR